MKNYLFIIVALLFSLSTFSGAYRPLAKNLNEKGYELSLKGSLLSSSGGYDVNGEEVLYEDGESFSSTQGEGELIYGYSRKLQIGLGMRFRQNSATYFVNDESTTNSVSGLESYFLNMQYGIPYNRKFWYFFSGEVRNTSYTNTIYETIPTDEIVLGDSGLALTLGGGFSYLFGKESYTNIWVGYRRPGNDLSNEIPYHFDLVIGFDNIGVYAGLEGIQSMSGDPYKDEPSDKPIQATLGTGLYNSINQSYNAALLGGFYSTTKWKFDFNIVQVLSGISTDQWLRIGGGITYRFGGKSSNSIKTSKFKEYSIEGVVLKVSPRGKFLRVDVGLSQDVEKGTRFDIYQADFFGGNILVAEAIAYEVGASKSILKVIKKLIPEKIKKGFLARATGR